MIGNGERMVHYGGDGYTLSLMRDPMFPDQWDAQVTRRGVDADLRQRSFPDPHRAIREAILDAWRTADIDEVPQEVIAAGSRVVAAARALGLGPGEADDA